jgi:hypothetical protein
VWLRVVWQTRRRVATLGEVLIRAAPEITQDGSQYKKVKEHSLLQTRKRKGKAIPLQALTSPEVSRRF